MQCDRAGKAAKVTLVSIKNVLAVSSNAGQLNNEKKKKLLTTVVKGRKREDSPNHISQIFVKDARSLDIRAMKRISNYIFNN